MIHDPETASADSLRVLVKILRTGFFFFRLCILPVPVRPVTAFQISVFTVPDREIFSIPDGHHLDKSDVHRQVFREGNKGADIVFAECQRHGVDFHAQA